MKVSLIAHTPDPELVVATAAKLCYSDSNIDQLMEAQTSEEVKKFIERLSSMGHESPFEHAVFTFAIEDVSRSLLAQITRHRIASYSVQSQRYVNMQNAKCVVPPVIEGDEGLLTLYANASKVSHMVYGEILHRLVEKYMSEGLSQKDATKKAQEDARFILPNSCGTRLIVTMNARSLMNFFKLRCCNRAQWEIRELAAAMLELCKQAAPNIFKYAGPACVKGKCKEGAMSCGHPWKKREAAYEQA